MDGVLLTPRGYHQALRETVRLIGQALGYADVELSPAHIAAFEAAGITSEWHSAAICAVLMLTHLWDHIPGLTLPEELTNDEAPRHNLPPPGWGAFLEALNRPQRESQDPLQKAEAILNKGKPEKIRREIQQILQNADKIEHSLTHRVFQELVLGSQVFQQTYQVPAWFDAQSYLKRYDRPAFPETLRPKLFNWLRHDQHRAVIFTNRPSSPPGDHFGTPEAQIGARTAGLEAFPLVGFGELSWLGEQLGVAVRYLHKPAATHALAALLVGLGIPREEALKRAAALALRAEGNRLWEQLEGARVYVFEDTLTGITSVRRACQLLNQHSVSISTHLCGITSAASKRDALTAAGAAVYPNLGAALATILT
jgi:hypothetical protein